MRTKHTLAYLLTGALFAAFRAGALAETPPSIVTQPQGQIVSPGSTVTFTVEAAGDEPLTYRWRRSGTTLSGRTNATLVVTNVATRDTGYYDVVVSNPYGSKLSDYAPLTFFSLTRVPEGMALDLEGFRGYLGGPPAVYELRCLTDVAATTWTVLTNFTLPTSPYRWVDTGPTNAQRYYRAVLLPGWHP